MVIAGEIRVKQNLLPLMDVLEKRNSAGWRCLSYTMLMHSNLNDSFYTSLLKHTNKSKASQHVLMVLVRFKRRRNIAAVGK